MITSHDFFYVFGGLTLYITCSFFVSMFLFKSEKDGEKMGKRWGKDGEKMGKRWGKDGEKIGKRLGKDWEGDRGEKRVTGEKMRRLNHGRGAERTPHTCTLDTAQCSVV